MRIISLTGLNVQAPWSELLITGKKTIETRRYPLPERLKNIPLAVIETPGKRKDFKARIIGVITFVDSKEYQTKKSWIKDKELHLVEQDDRKFGFKEGEKKFGWIVGKFCRLDVPLNPPQLRGIIFARGCEIPEKFLRNLK